MDSKRKVVDIAKNMKGVEPKRLVKVSKSKAYDIKHCMYCGERFDSTDEVILHIKSKHMVIGSG